MNINIWLTKKCNLKCTYCYEGIDKETESITFEICDKIVSYINQINDTVNIRFHGGEPLLEYEKLKYLYRKLKVLPNVKTFGVTTNGTLLNTERIEFLASCMNDLSISIDGSRHIHDLNRKDIFDKGSYDKIVKIIPEVLKKKPYSRARMTVTPNNVIYLHESIKNIVNLGFKIIAVAVDIYDKKWSEENKNQYLEQVRNVYREYKDNSDLHISVIEKNNIKKLAPCGGGKNSIHISTDGMFYPCSFAVGIDEFVIGDINKGIIDKEVQKIENIGHNINEDCNGCTLYNFCAGTRCKIVNKIVSGAYNIAPTATCMDTNVRVSVLY